MDSSPRHFIIAGAQRSATTFLMQMLDAHPAIEMAKPARPEPKVFLDPDCQGLTIETYRETFFKGRTGETKWLGEKSTSYYENPTVVARIAAFYDAPKLIFVLRDPVERAISNYHFSRMNGFETADIDVALSRELDAPEMVVSSSRSGTSVSPQAYLARGRYADFLPAFYSVLPQEDILLIQSERLIANASTRDSIFEFFGLLTGSEDFSFTPINESRKSPEQVLSPATRQRLAAYFRESNAQLSREFDFDVSEWQ